MEMAQIQADSMDSQVVVDTAIMEAPTTLETSVNGGVRLKMDPKPGFAL
jgi:hypothetical protein